jgi:toxin ParE1/3/4
MSEAHCHIGFAQSARDDLRDILDWYASQEVSQVGTRMVLQIVARVRQLAMFPDSGRVVPELETPWLRELEHPPFRIVYRRDEAVVTIVRVRRSERLMDPGLLRNA